jgi:hypothetical protein
MAKAPRLYTRLTRSPVNPGSYKSLWLAGDHLMQVDSNGYTEEYQRFQFSDIQGFFITPSSRRLYWSLFWGVILLIAGLALIGAALNAEVPGASLVFTVISLGFLIWNIALGASCRVFLVTRVQTVPLGALGRRRKANRVLGRIQPLIEAAQAGLVVETPLAKTAFTSQPTPAVPEVRPAPMTPPVDSSAPAPTPVSIDPAATTAADAPPLSP